MTVTGGTAPFIPDINLLERLFLEERRRTKIIAHAFGERPVLKLMYAAGDPRGRPLARADGRRV